MNEGSGELRVSKTLFYIFKKSSKLPNITPHSFRYTYCTNMANGGMNPNTLQYLMGHANITMTLGYYAHGTFQSAKAELVRLAC